MRYRAEIDGIRAVAVIPVILFHAGIPGFDGGFVGVDVFFVLSGYLITTILLTELHQGSFTALGFWERRARRILPPLFVVIFACLPVAWALMLPHELKDFGQSVAAAVTFSANILFWRENGYFAGPADEKPLLHVWSLSVEEQFYLLFPLLILVLWRSRWLWPALLAVAVLSFLASDWGTRNASGAAYFLLPFRAWELLVGSLCAIWLLRRPAMGSDLLSVPGLVLVGYAVVTYSGAGLFPGRAALVPILGTALLVLFCQRGTWTARLLSQPLLVGIGLISYSLYLWHQPVFAFLRLSNFGTLTPVMALAALPMITLLAWASWRFVETPWRRRDRIPRRVVFPASFAAAGLAAMLGTALHLSGGAAWRLPPDAPVVARQPMPCHDINHTERMAISGFCVIGDATATPTTLLIGDSHAGHLTAALDTALRQRGQAMAVVSQSWCAPLLGISTDIPDRGAGCDTLMRQVHDRLAREPDIETIILAAQWGNFLTGGRWGTVPIAYRGADGAPGSLAQNPQVFADAVEITAQAVQKLDRRVIVVGPVPEYDLHVPDALARMAWKTGQAVLPDAHQRISADQQRFAGTIRQPFASLPVFHTWLDPADRFCREATCRYAAADGTPLYRDANHLSLRGAELVVAELLALVPQSAGGVDQEQTAWTSLPRAPVRPE